MRVAEDRARWREIGEAYVQQWTVVGCPAVDWATILQAIQKCQISLMEFKSY
jgi:hypothetical protein